MTADEWDAAKAMINEEFYGLLVGTAECGPFDGCCVLFAHALQNIVGGEIHVVVARTDRADHAAVFLDGQLWDYDGPRPPPVFLSEFNKNEMLREDRACIGHRPIRDGDLAEAVRDPDLQEKVADLLSSVIVPSPPSLKP